MSIFCSFLQTAYDLKPKLPENEDYVSYSIQMYENTKDTNKSYFKDEIVLLLYTFIINLYLKTKHFGLSQNKIRVKFEELKNVCDNGLYSSKDKTIFISLFSKAQKNYLALCKFAHICKMKCSPIKVKSDLMLNEIDVRKKNVFIFCQNNANYAFVINDLINIIDSSLSNCSYWYAEPNPIKNPYTNVELSKTILYNLYFFIRSNLYSMPMLFELYFRCNFHLKDFKLNNENYIREINIKNFTTRSHYTVLYRHVIDMLQEYRCYTNKIIIDTCFPKKILVDRMRSYLEYYLLSKYLVFGSEKKYSVEKTLRKKLFKFSKCNPNFGKKMVKIVSIAKKSKKICKKIEYNTDCISFYDDTKQTFFINWEEFEEICNTRVSDYSDEEDDSYDD